MLNGSNMHFKLRRARLAEGRVTLIEVAVCENEKISISTLVYSGMECYLLNITDEL